MSEEGQTILPQLWWILPNKLLTPVNEPSRVDVTKEPLSNSKVSFSSSILPYIHSELFTFIFVILVGSGIIISAMTGRSSVVAIPLVYTCTMLLMGILQPQDRDTLSIIAVLLAWGLAGLIRLDPSLAWRQVCWLSLGGLAYLISSRVSFHFLKRYIHYFAITGVLVVLLTPIVGQQIKGAIAWINIYGFSLQPIEAVKLALVLMWGKSIANKGSDNLTKVYLSLTSALFALGLFWQRDLGPLLVLIFTMLFWIITCKFNIKSLISAGLVALPCIFIATYLPHIQNRLFAWLSPEADKYGLGFQTIQLTYALVKGAWLGQGWNNTNLFVPAAARDIPISVIAENSGLLGILGVLILLYLLIYKLLKTSILQTDTVFRHFALGLTFLLASQIFLNLAGSSRLLPLVGITLPFLSYGGSSLIISFVIIGLCAQLKKKSTLKLKTKPLKYMVSNRLIGICVMSSFVVLISSFFYWSILQGPSIRAEAGYQRIAQPQGLNRGGIISRSGEALSIAIQNGDNSQLMRYVGPNSLIHTVGYIHPIYGASGLEATFDNALSGLKQLRGDLEVPTGVWDVVTTIDLSIQNLLEQHFSGEKGAIVILNPWNGEVLAIASFPHYDADNLENTLTALPTEGPMLNRAVSGLYPPGSTIKPFILAAALEAGTVKPDTIFIDQVKRFFDGVQIKNFGEQARGELDVKEALAYSSNVIFAEIAHNMQPATLKRWFTAFGIGEVKGIEIPIRHGSWGEVNSRAELAYMGIGQGELLVTPLEMAVAIATIANGGYRVEPRLVSYLQSPLGQYKIDNSSVTKVLSNETVKIVSQGLEAAVSVGTAKGLISSQLLAGKTGTAENPHGLSHGWFVGYAPSKNPVVAIAIVIENAGSGRVAAVVAADLVESMVNTGLLRINGEQVNHDW